MTYGGSGLTNEKNETIRRGFCSTRPVRAKQGHTTNNRAEEIDVEDGIYVDKMEDYGDSQESKAADGRHGSGLKEEGDGRLVRWIYLAGNIK